MQSGRRLTDLEPAGFARRAAAFFVDLFVAGVVVVVLLQLVLDPLRDALGPGWARVGWFYIGYTLLTVSLPIWAYFAGYESRADHATPGKRWLGVTVASTGAKPLSFGRAFLRTILKLLPFEVAHVFLAVPANPFIDPLTHAMTVPGFDDLGASVHAGLLVAVLLAGAQLFTMLLHPDGRGVHDLVAHTFVVRADDARDAGGSALPVPGRAGPPH